MNNNILLAKKVSKALKGIRQDVKDINKAHLLLKANDKSLFQDINRVSNKLKELESLIEHESNQNLKKAELLIDEANLTASEIRDKLESLKGNRRLDASAIKNLNQHVGGGFIGGPGGAGVSDHGELEGLLDDDHIQYHNDTRGDARYYTQTLLNSTANGKGASLIGIEDTGTYYTGTDVEAALQEIGAGSISAFKWTESSNILEPATDGNGVLIDVPTASRSGLTLQTTDDNTTNYLLRTLDSSDDTRIQIGATERISIGLSPDFTERLNFSQGHIAFTTPSAGTQPSLASAGAGNKTGNYRYRYTYVNEDGGESIPSAVQTIVGLSSEDVNVSGVTTGPTGTTARNIYRSGGGDGGDQFTMWYVGQIADNTTTLFVDTVADGITGNAQLSFLGDWGGQLKLDGSVFAQVSTTGARFGLNAGEGQSSATFGYNAGTGQLGQGVTALGHGAASSGNMGGSDYITAVGNSAGAKATGDDSTYLGALTGTKITSGTNNLIAGKGGGQNLGSASSNLVLLGRHVANSVSSTVTGSIAIGQRVADNGSFGSNQLWIHNSNTTTPLIYGEFTSNNEFLRVNGNLEVIGKNDDLQLLVKANATQTANLTEWQNSSGTVLSAFDEGGWLGVGTDNPTVELDVYGQAQFNYGSADGGISIGANLNSTARTSNVRKFGNIVSIDYSNTKVVEIFSFDSTSATTAISSFGGRPGASNYASTNIRFVTKPSLSATGGNVNMDINEDGDIGIGTTSQTAKVHIFGMDNESAVDALKIEDENNNMLFRVATTGAGNADRGRAYFGAALHLGSDTNPSARFQITGTSDEVQEVIKANASQTANLQEWQNNSGTTLSFIDNVGLGDFAGLKVNSAYEFPTADGNANEVLITDGAGNLDFGVVGQVQAVDTEENVLATSTPADGEIKFGSDSKKMYVYSSSQLSWNELPISFMPESGDGNGSPGIYNQQIGTGRTFGEDSGYYDRYYGGELAGVTIKGNSGQNTGGIRTSGTNLQFYDGTAWVDVVTGFRARESSDGTLLLEHQPTGFDFYYDIKTGNSDELALNDEPKVRNYNGMPGIYGSTRTIINGGTF